MCCVILSHENGIKAFLNVPSSLTEYSLNLAWISRVPTSAQSESVPDGLNLNVAVESLVGKVEAGSSVIITSYEIQT